MKTIQEIVSKVQDPASKWETRHQYSTSKVQQTVLEALGINANNYGHAEAIFKALGIIVSNRREGRRTVPVITVLESEVGGWNAGGDGDSVYVSNDLDFSPLAEWIE